MSEQPGTERTLLDRLVEATAEMRSRQKHYFTTRTPEALSEARRWEREVDRLLAAVQSPQGSLFG